MAITTTESIRAVAPVRCNQGHVALGGVVLNGHCSKDAKGLDLELILAMIGDASEPAAEYPPLVASDPMNHQRGVAHPAAARVLARLIAGSDRKARQATGDRVKAVLDEHGSFGLDSRPWGNEPDGETVVVEALRGPSIPPPAGVEDPVLAGIRPPLRSARMAGKRVSTPLDGVGYD